MSHAQAFHMTSKQHSIMRVIVKGNADGSFTDIDEILLRLPYETSKQSLQFSVRALVKHGLIEKKGKETRRGRSRVVIGPTMLGYKIANPQYDVIVEGV